MPRQATIPLMLGILAGLLLPISLLRAAPPAPRPPQAFVKVNQFYLLYTYPVVPYLNKKGVLMAGLEGFGRALFDKAPAGDAQAQGYGGDDYGRVTTDAARRETLTLGAHTLTFTADSATARADGADVPLEAPAHWDAAGAMVVPVQGLARCLGLDAEWEPTRHVLRVTAPDRMASSDADSGGAHRGANPDVLVPWRVTYHAGSAPAGVKDPFGASGGSRTPWLMVEARNVSPIFLRLEELNVLALFSKGEMSSNLDGIGHVLGDGDGPSPTIPPGGVRRFPLALQGDPNNGSVPLCVVSYPDAVTLGAVVAPTGLSP